MHFVFTIILSAFLRVNSLVVSFIHFLYGFRLIVCTVFLSMGCFTTTDAVYDNKPIEVAIILSLIDVGIISHQNNMGVLFYTVDGLYHNSETGRTEEIGDKFPFSTYSDAQAYKNEHADKFEKTIIRKVTRYTKEIVEPEKREFSPVRTALAIGLPTLGALTIILSMVFNPPDKSK